VAYEERLHREGTVQWSYLRRTEKTEAGEVRPIYETGIAFERVLSQLGAEILAFLEETVILETENRFCARFRPASSETTQVSADYVFRVAQLSLSGMLVSADFSLVPGEVFEAEVQLDGETVRTQARVVHVREVGSATEPGYLIGIEFRDLADDQRQILQGFIRQEIERGTPDVAS